MLCTPFVWRKTSCWMVVVDIHHVVNDTGCNRAAHVVGKQHWCWRPGTPLGDQLAAVLQLVLTFKLFVAFQIDCAPAGKADEMTAATSAG